MWKWNNSQGYMNTAIWETNERNVNSDFVTRSLTSNYQSWCWREARLEGRAGSPEKEILKTG